MPSKKTRQSSRKSGKMITQDTARMMHIITYQGRSKWSSWGLGLDIGTTCTKRWESAPQTYAPVELPLKRPNTSYRSVGIWLTRDCIFGQKLIASTGLLIWGTKRRRKIIFHLENDLGDKFDAKLLVVNVLDCWQQFDYWLIY